MKHSRVAVACLAMGLGLVLASNEAARAAGASGAAAAPAGVNRPASPPGVSVKMVLPAVQRPAQNQTRMLSVDPIAGGALTQDLKIEVVNAARQAAAMAPLAPDVAAALAGGVMVTPASPSTPVATLGYAGKGDVLFDGKVVWLPLPVSTSPWEEAHVWLDATLVPNHLYVLDCDIGATNKHVPTVAFAYNTDIFSETEPDPKTHHSFFAFRARDPKATLNLTARRKPSEATQPYDQLIFRSCTLLPAQ